MGAKAAKTTFNDYPIAEFESRIARRDFRGLTKDVLPTPCMVVDKALFEQNVTKMSEHCKTTGINIRPHVKVHKSVDIAKRQIQLGAIGLTTATIAEAELMSGSGLKNVMWTKQPVGVNNISRAIALAKKDPTFIFVVDDPQVVDWIEEAAAATNAQLKITVDVFSGMKRHGMQPGQPALNLAQKVDKSKRLHFQGLMGYSGSAAHTRGWEARRVKSGKDLAGLMETVDLCKKAGLNVKFVSGGSTGTYNIDKEHGLTELEAGTYVFMDSGYRRIGGKDGDPVYNDWAGAMTVLTTVGSQRWDGQVTIDYGNKAMANPTDQVKGMPWLSVGNQGAEYGSLLWKDDAPSHPKLGDRIEIYCTTLDMSTHAYDRYYVAQGDQIVDVWPIMGRVPGAAQR
jgi:D-serine deaminase-like pyridoxal phosphate-dependent protein